MVLGVDEIVKGAPEREDVRSTLTNAGVESYTVSRLTRANMIFAAVCAVQLGPVQDGYPPRCEPPCGRDTSAAF